MLLIVIDCFYVNATLVLMSQLMPAVLYFLLYVVLELLSSSLHILALIVLGVGEGVEEGGG